MADLTAEERAILILLEEDPTEKIHAYWTHIFLAVLNNQQNVLDEAQRDSLSSVDADALFQSIDADLSALR